MIGVAIPHHIAKRRLGTVIPVPGVIKRLDLRGGFRPGRSLEQDIIRRVGIERRVEVDQVNAVISDAVAQHAQVIAAIQMIHARPLIAPVMPGSWLTPP